MDKEYRKSFAPALEASKSSQLKVQQYLLGLGIPCTINPTIMVPPGGDPENYKDGGDLYMNMRTEVKNNPDTEWEGKDDYPHDDILICARSAVDDQAVPPKYFFIVNGPETKAAVIDVNKTKHLWSKWQAYDGRPGRGYEYPAYYINKDSEEIKWITL